MEEEISPLRRGVIELENKFTSILEMGIAFSSNKELNTLLESILLKSKKIAHCEAGSIFLVDTLTEGGEDKKVLRFKAIQNDSVSKFQLFNSAVEYTLPLNKNSIAGYVAITKETLNIKDPYQIDGNEPYKFDDSFDKKLGFKTGSILAMPVLNSTGEAIGVLEMINRIDYRTKKSSKYNSTDNPTMPFLSSDIETVKWVADLAGVAVENMHTIDQLRWQNDKLDKMVKEQTCKLNSTLEMLEKERKKKE